MSEPVPSPEWLEAANLHATVSQLLSTVIHQVNNALQTIGGHAELLKTDPGVTETTRRRATTITSVTDRTAELLASLQVFTRPAVGLDVYDLREVAVRALAFRHYGLGRARIQATLDGESGLWVRGEIRPLTQAVLNIVLNAEQAMAALEAPGRLSLALARQEDDVVLAVEDTGPGPGEAGGAPAAADAPTGAAVSWATAGAANRLGLGLVAARQIVARHGGTIAVSRLPNAGTRVEMRLPAARPPA